MKRHDQVWLKGNALEFPGDCVRACVACLLDLELHEVPHFVELHDVRWSFYLDQWLYDLGLELEFSEGQRNCGEGLCIYTGPSPRGGRHAVVGLHGQYHHDPHTSREFLVGQADHTYEIIPLVRPL